MEDYLKNFKKYNKLIYKFMYNKIDDDYQYFIPNDAVSGVGILFLTIHKINNMFLGSDKMRFLLSIKKNEVEIYIQRWHDVSKKDGYVNIVHIKENCLENQKEIIDITHKVIYNSCVDFIIKTQES